MIKIIIPGCPIAKARARTFTRRGRTMTYDTQHAEKTITALQIKSQCVVKGYCFELDDTFTVDLTLYMPLPLSLPKSKANAILWGFESHYGKQDIDNLVKFYLDCANGILYPDDHQITKITAEIKYSMEPRTEMTVNVNEKIKLDHDGRKILELFSLGDLDSLIESVKKINQYQIAKLNNWFDPDECYREIAKAISKIAEDHTDQLNKVKKACPKYHEKAILHENGTA